jgi:hypothetical protein
VAAGGGRGCGDGFHGRHGRHGRGNRDKEGGGKLWKREGEVLARALFLVNLAEVRLSLEDGEDVDNLRWLDEAEPVAEETKTPRGQ